MPAIIERIPQMTDVELANLRDNAERLSKAGTDKQIAAASALLPAVIVEIDARKAKRQAAQAAARIQRRKVSPAAGPATE